MLDELDKELDRRGNKVCRYADDFSIYCKSQWQARKTGNEIFLFPRVNYYLLLIGRKVESVARKTFRY
jgi:retron-type reverse transcriptase